MITAIDTSVLLLIQKRQQGWMGWKHELEKASKEGSLVVCSVVFAEVSTGYPSTEVAYEDLQRLQMEYDTITPASTWLAGQIFLKYRREGGPRHSLIPDFLIAAHASVQADRLAATDRGHLRRYFPKLQLLRPG